MDQQPIEYDIGHYDLCLEQATEALANDEVAIGCVFVDYHNNTVITKDRNRVNQFKNATRHAEINCIDNIVAKESQFDFTSIDVYVTCEPCIMCARILRHLKVRRVIYGCSNERFGGCVSVLRVADGLENIIAEGEPPLQYIKGVRADESIRLLKEFYGGENLNAPEELRKIKKIKEKSNDE